MGKLRRFFNQALRRPPCTTGYARPHTTKAYASQQKGEDESGSPPTETAFLDVVTASEPHLQITHNLASEPSHLNPENLSITLGQRDPPGAGFYDKPIDANIQGKEGPQIVRTQWDLQTHAADGPTGSLTESEGLPSPPSHFGGLLHHAHYLLFNGSVFGEHIEMHHNPSVLEKMTEYILPGADLTGRDDPPRCHPNTRTEFLSRLQTHIHESSLGTKIVWLVGPAGVGKTAIMQTLAEIESLRSTCAALFLSRLYRDDPKKVFTTLAYTFAVVDSEYRRYISERLAAEPGFLASSVEEQFKRLFVTPFATRASTPRRWVVLLDGLDECHGERQQHKIIKLIRDSILHFSETTPFVWIIASRPEAHLQATFTQIEKDISGFQKVEVPIDSDDALQSVELYLRAEFAKIQQSYSDIVPLLWPLESNFQQLALASPGLFAFASALVDYAGEEDPILRLRHILFLIGQHSANRIDSHYEPKANPFQPLDLLYSKIMSAIPPAFLPITRMILAFYLLVVIVPVPAEAHTEKPADLLLVCNILGLEQHTAYAALRKLYSVLSIPSPKEAGQNTVKFYHPSFSDYLIDRSRSQSYYIDLNEELEKIWQSLVKTLRSAPSRLDIDNVVLSWETPDMINQEFRKTLLRRARNRWLGVLVECCHRNSCTHERQYRLTLSTSELIDIFEEFSSIIFESEYLHVEGFCDWLFNHAPVALCQRMILRKFDLDQLGEHDLDNMFTGIYAREWGCCVTESSWRVIDLDLTDLNITRWSEVKRSVRPTESGDYLEESRSRVHWSILGELPRLKSLEYSDIKVVIMGMRPTYYTVIGPVNDHPYFPKDDIQYLIFPYVEMD